MRSTKATITASAAAVVAAAGFVLSGGVAAADPTTPVPAPAPKNSIEGNGTFKVGTDVMPGAYTSAGPLNGSACYWKRTAGDKVVDNGLTKRSPVIVIDPTDTTFTTSDCQTWTMTDCSQSQCPPPPGSPPPGALGPLMSILGSQLNPGASSGPPPSSAPPAPGAAGSGPAPGPAPAG